MENKTPPVNSVKHRLVTLKSNIDSPFSRHVTSPYEALLSTKWSSVPQLNEETP